MAKADLEPEETVALEEVRDLTLQVAEAVMQEDITHLKEIQEDQIQHHIVQVQLVWVAAEQEQPEQTVDQEQELEGQEQQILLQVLQ